VRYLPCALIQPLIIPLVKCNNYRAIAISTAVSKLLESVIASHAFSLSETENNINNLDLRLSTLLAFVQMALKRRLITM